MTGSHLQAPLGPTGKRSPATHTVFTVLICFLASLCLYAALCPGSVKAHTNTPGLAKTLDTYDASFIHKFLAPGQYMPLSEVKPGMVGYGLTVFQGTRVERFSVRVIGIVKKVLNGRDAILVRMSGGPLANNNVIKGMSGSPIYIDGKLVGAVSFGFDFSKEPIAGVTPIVDMLDAMAADHIGKARIAAKQSLPWYAPRTQTTFTSGGAPRMVPLVAPLSLAGFSANAQEFLRQRLANYGLDVAQGGAGAQDPALAKATHAGIVPGGSVSILLATGDFNVVATGTVTARFANKVLAFGHPFLQAGKVEFPMATAFVHEVLPSLFVSFKMASPLNIVGAMTADRPWSVGGQIGHTARLIPVSYTVTDRTRNIKRVYRCQVVDHPNLTPELVASTAMSAIDATHQSNGPYVATVESIIEASGVEPLVRTDRFSSNFSAHTAGDGGKFHFLADPVGAFLLRNLSEITNNDFVSASVKSVNLNVTLDDGHQTARLDRIFIDKPFVAPGEVVDVHCLLKPYDGKDKLETVSFKLPRDMPDGQMVVGICSGDEVTSLKKRMGIVDPMPESLLQVVDRLRDKGRGDALELIAALPGQSLMVGGIKLDSPPAHWAHVFLSNRNTASPVGVKSDIRVDKVTDWLIDGSHLLTVEVRSPEKVIARQAPYVPPLPSHDDAIVSTDQARKTIESARKSHDSANGPAANDGKPAVSSAAGLSSTLKEYPHMRPALVWRQDSDDDFRSGKLDGTTVDSWGRLMAGYTESASVPVPGESAVWSAIWSKEFYYFGTAGKIWRWSGGESRPELVCDLGGVAVSALAADENGTIYAASVPGGSIWSVDGKGKARLLCKVEEPIVTSLCTDEHGNLYAGVAGSGKIYKISADGHAQDFFAAPVAHILSLFYCRQDKRIYAGCGESGVVYAINGEKHAEAVYQTAEHLVTGVVRDRAGDLYVATAASGKLIRLVSSGEVQTLATSEAFYRLIYDPASDSVFAGDGEGDITLCRVDPLSRQGYFVPVCHTEQEEVLALACDGNRHLAAGTANLAFLREFELKPAANALYQSAIRDAGKTANWISLSVWGALQEPQAALEHLAVESRTGDSALPDNTWSAWKQATYKDGTYVLNEKPARYLQYRLRFTAAGKATPPPLGKLEVTYLPGDSAPKVVSVSVKPDNPLSGKQEIAVTGVDPDSDNLLLAVDISSDCGQTWKALAENIRGKHAKSGSGSKLGSDADARDNSASKSEREGSVPKNCDDREKKEEKKGASEDQAPTDGSGRSADQNKIRYLGDEKDGKSTDEGNNKEGESGKEGTDDKEKDKASADKGKATRKASAAKIKSGAAAGSSQSEKGSEGVSNEEKLTWNFDTTKVKDGNYILRFTISDSLSNPEDSETAVALRAITVANKPPHIGDLSFNVDASGKLRFAVAVSSQFAPIANACYRIDDGEPFAMAGWSRFAGGMIGQLGAGGISLSSGSHKLEVKVTDKAGNSATRTFTVK